ncbi:MAG: hypothetical protein FGM37_05570 [Phycisphaerales bacterium]|nr:hypothetical protein [Phycisphaerales bacterium]
MPQYEYICEDDGEVITLLRSMRDADAPVEDPSGKGRRFVRKLSCFGVAGSEAGTGSSHVHLGSCCPCGKPSSACGRN